LNSVFGVARAAAAGCVEIEMGDDDA